MKKYFILFTVLSFNLSQHAFAGDLESDIAAIQEVAIMKAAVSNSVAPSGGSVEKEKKEDSAASVAQAQLVQKVEAGIGELNKKLDAKDLSKFSAKTLSSKGADRAKAVSSVNAAWSEYQAVVANSLGITNAARGTELSQSLLKVKLQMFSQILRDSSGKVLNYNQMDVIAPDLLRNVDSQPTKESAAKPKSAAQIIGEIASFVKSNNADGIWSDADVAALTKAAADSAMKLKSGF